MPWGTRWVLGGGSRKRALATVRAAVNLPSDFFTHAEAKFALWDMQVRERNLRGAAEAGRELADDFPDNREVAAFLETREARGRRWRSYAPRVSYDFSVRRTELALSVSGIGGDAHLLSIALYPMAAEHPLLPMAYRIGLTPPRLPVSHRINRINSTSPSNPPP
jgi:hypothetical protein